MGIGGAAGTGWARLVERGSGTAEFRLMIEGWPYEFVTNSDMERTTADDRIRVAGLQREGLQVSDKTNPVYGEIEASGMSVAIVEDPNKSHSVRATQSFAYQPDQLTFLTANATAGATSLSVKSTVLFGASGTVHIGTEAVYYTSSNSTTFLNCTRARWNTIAQGHYTEDGERLGFPAIYNRPPTAEGRRCILYGYGPGDSLTGAGTAIWRGLVAEDPVLAEGGVWQLTLDPITRLFDQPVGMDVEMDFTLRGVYYPWNSPIRVCLTEHNSATPSGTPTNRHNFAMPGQWETQEAFLADLNTNLGNALTAASPGPANFTTSIRAVPTDDGYKLQADTDATNVYYVTIEIHDPCGFEEGTPGVQTGGYSHTWTQVDTGVDTSTFVADKLYVLRTFEGNARVPRGCFGRGEHLYAANTGANRTSYPDNYLYVGGSIEITDLSAITVKWPMSGGGSETVSYNIAYLNTTSRFFALDRDGDWNYRKWGTTASATQGFGEHGAPILRASMNARVTGTLYDFLNDLTTNSHKYTTIGGMPLVTTDDVNISDCETVIDAAVRGKAFAQRRYTYIGGETLEEYLAHEFRLLGIFPALDSDGKITLKRIETISDATSEDATIDSSNTIMSEGFPDWSRAPMGLINSLRLKTGYSIMEEKHMGPTYFVRDVTALSFNRVARTLEIAPLSEPTVALENIVYQPEELQSLFAPVLSTFSQPYASLTLTVPMTLFDVTVGSFVKVSNEHLPDLLNGNRGFTNRLGMVLGREWDLAAGVGRLDIMLTGYEVPAYTPVSKPSDKNLVAGNVWELNIGSQSGPFTGVSDWQSGDQLAAVTYDANARSGLAGEVLSVGTGTYGTNTIWVEFDSAWTPGATDWTLRYDDADQSLQASQEVSRAFQSGTDGVLGFSSGNLAAKLFRGG